MTEAGRKWLEGRNAYASIQQGWDKEAEFWLRAFCGEVDKLVWPKDEDTVPLLLGEAFRTVRDNLLGEEKA